MCILYVSFSDVFPLYENVKLQFIQKCIFCLKWVNYLLNQYIFFAEVFLEVGIENWPEWDLNHNHWILLRCSNWLSLQSMSSALWSQFCTATQIPLFVKYSDFFLATAFAVTTLILIEIFHRLSHVYIHAHIQTYVKVSKTFLLWTQKCCRLYF